MIAYGKQWITPQDIKSVDRILRSGWVTQGPAILAFEKKLAKYCGAKYVVAVNNGTSALHLAYLASGIEPGDEVITTPNSFVATSNMLLAIGAKPVFADIRLDTYNIDETKIEKLITQKTRAIVPIDFAGQPSAMAEIKKIASKHKLLIIDDGAHALGAKYNGKKVGGLADLTTFSFHPVKPITTGEGGAVATNNKKYYDKLLLLRSQGVQKDKAGKNVMTVLGYNYRMTDFQAALGSSQLQRLNFFLKKRHQVAAWYKRELKDLKDIILPQEIKGNYSGWHIYVVRVTNPRRRNKLMKYLKQQGIGVNFHFPPIYKQPYYRQHGFSKTSLKNAELYEATALTLPLHPQLTKKEVNYIVGRIKRFYNKYEI